MGYDLHITRAVDWIDSEKDPIAIEAWMTYVNQDPEMRLDGFAEATVANASVLRVDADGLSVWTAYSGHGVDGNMAWFDWHDGRVVVKSPDQEIIGKMKQIARHFGAHVVGDEGEEY